VLEEMTGLAGLEPVTAGEVDVPYQPPDQETLLHGLLAGGTYQPAIARSGEQAVRRGGHRGSRALPPAGRLLPLRQQVPVPHRGQEKLTFLRTRFAVCQPSQLD
jgi:hypothetical protein